ncbi:MAG: Gfo/Idh/MocA family protein [Intestinibacillus sp.]
MELKIGVIGCGAIGREHIARLNGKLQGGKVVAVSDLFFEGAKKVADSIGASAYENGQDLVNDPNVDAIVVTSPGFAHKDSVMQAIAAGKPVFSEKPLATSAADCLEIVEAEIAAGKHLVQVGFMRRYDKGYRQVKALVDENKYGLPLMLHCTHRNPAVGESYDTPQAVTETMIHEIDVLHWLIDDEYESAQVVIPRSTKNTHPKLKDPQIMMLRTKGGICIDVEVFVNCRFGYDIECEVVCEEGVIKMPEPSFPMVRAEGARHTPIETDWKTRFIEAYDVELQDWVFSTLKGEVNGPTAWDGYLASVTADALVKAQISGAIEPIVTDAAPLFYKNHEAN